MIHPIFTNTYVYANVYVCKCPILQCVSNVYNQLKKINMSIKLSIVSVFSHASLSKCKSFRSLIS